MKGLRTLKRRRRENKTDYKARRILLESGLTRLVVRKTNKYFIIQAVESSEGQDTVIATTTSRDLLKNGWDKKFEGSLKSVPAGYLTGLLMAKKLKHGRYIMDLGMARTLKGGRIYSVVKGLIDGKLDIPANPKIFPAESRLNGEHLKPEVKAIFDKIKGVLI